jgi:predicted regulator of Ras-like GTPase activity (Roadblock/LC7/MglB family)
MSVQAQLREALAPLAEEGGVVAALVLTRDGLPVEMIGHGVRADVLAAEGGALAEACRSAANRLMLGEADEVTLRAPGYRLTCLLLGNHALALVLAGDEAGGALDAARATVGKLREALGEGA